MTYTVKSGDTLTKIAQAYGVTVDDIYNLNKNIIGSNPNAIKVGQVYTLPSTASSTPKASSAPLYALNAPTVSSEGFMDKIKTVLANKYILGGIATGAALLIYYLTGKKEN